MCVSGVEVVSIICLCWPKGRDNHVFQRTGTFPQGFVVVLATK